jgi:AcrR family transcriptional regulator
MARSRSRSSSNRRHPNGEAALTEKNRQRILACARSRLLSEDFSEFRMETVAHKADVIRPTLYYQFKSKTGLLEAGFGKGMASAVPLRAHN